MESLYCQMKKEYDDYVNWSKCTHLCRGIITNYYSQNINYPEYRKWELYSILITSPVLVTKDNKMLSLLRLCQNDVPVVSQPFAGLNR